MVAIGSSTSLEMKCTQSVYKRRPVETINSIIQSCQKKHSFSANQSLQGMLRFATPPWAWALYGNVFRRLTRFLAIGILSLAAVIGLSPLALYIWGFSKLPESRLPPSLGAVPLLAQELMWAEYGGSSPPYLESENPYSYFFQIFSTRIDRSNIRLSSIAARVLLDREGGSRRPKHLVAASASIWVSRNWTAPEALTAILESAYYGHGFTGIYNASKGYYGVTPQELSRFDMAQLIVIEKAPSKYDPWCNPERNMVRVNNLLESDLELKESSKLLAKPEGACK